jgi:Tfp pilus assembly protein PilO
VKRTAPLLGGLSALLLAVAFYFLLYSPRVEDLELIRQETAQLETRRASLQNEVVVLREVEANQLQIRSALAKLEEYIPTGTAQSTAVRQFQLAADAAGVEITSVTFGSPTIVEGAPPTGVPETALARIPVEMSLEGGYFQAVDFLRRIEVETSRAIYVGNFVAREGEDSFPSLASTWIGELFAIVPIPAVPPVPGATPPPEAETEAPAEGDVPAEGETPEAPTTDDGTTTTAMSDEGATS